jgi:transcriptional regulator with XRE-family HTH domain
MTLTGTRAPVSRETRAAIHWKVVLASTDEVTAALGARVRSLRRERGWTLKQLGREAELSHPFLSQLERGLARPSVGSAERIARALQVPVGLLWSAPARGGAHELVRRDDGEHEPHDDVSAPGGMRILAAGPLAVREWTGGPRTWPDEHEVAAGDVLLYVARGGLEVELDGVVHALREGDALMFDGGVPHRLRRTGNVNTRALQVATPA